MCSVSRRPSSSRSQGGREQSWSYRSSSPDPETSNHRSRRPHRKSKAGCLVCKRRRVKCDETKPSCRRCQVHGVSCHYRSSDSQDTERNRALEILGEDAPPTADMFSMTLMVTARSITDLLKAENGPEGSNVGREYIGALHHFELFTSHTLGAPIARYIIRSQVLPLALSSPHVMHGLIAISKTHLHRLAPGYKGGAVDEVYHWQRTITLFQQEIMLPINQHNMNAVISTCMILAVLAFTCDDTKTAGSWIFSQTAGATNWLYVQGGLSAILSKYQDQADQNIWVPVINDADDHKGTISDDRPGPEGIPAGFVELCGIEEDSNRENNPYHAPLRVMANLQNIEPSSATFSKLVTFVGEVNHSYRELLRKKDPRALLILSHWFAMMCAVDQWWVQNRVRSECWAICRFLEKHSDVRIRRLLEFPARSCGYL
ncbi:hypothetical protein AJ79_00209 [Helicocarpus griseus UAMH5409]|uniref:Zn(2)-C6 fungal-type domain-containing protein n=1 Tax=Helicocarpus griseus UAMH5409 TaxID=1447875 RepID=A0A2B7YB83_9EURO|nr:hypothetical protein AJ79_00209 [Helicocarpus griseus UAMH5409]